MGRHRQLAASQGNIMGQYTTPISGLQRQTRVGGPGGVPKAPAPAEEPFSVELLAAIQGSRVVLEGKIEAVAVEVNLLRTDLRKFQDVTDCLIGDQTVHCKNKKRVKENRLAKDLNLEETIQIARSMEDAAIWIKEMDNVKKEVKEVKEDGVGAVGPRILLRSRYAPQSCLKPLSNPILPHLAGNGSARPKDSVFRRLQRRLRPPKVLEHWKVQAAQLN
ncbi:hypothetical protein NDU88_007076 [Pleurodeles waltl]|uniref:Uncharacterized protein n=1 Tax=Pleurodeles waltl TaxID=8319 RepID=A0AAV7PKK6_PLEWA|nr:hypothetical protein NDU88_007076 [Pleurodeles waltl]